MDFNRLLAMCVIIFTLVIGKSLAFGEAPTVAGKAHTPIAHKSERIKTSLISSDFKSLIAPVQHDTALNDPQGNIIGYYDSNLIEIQGLPVKH